MKALFALFDCQSPAHHPLQWTVACGWRSRCERAYPAIAWAEKARDCLKPNCHGTFYDAL